MAYTSFILRGAVGFTLGGLFFTQIQSRHTNLPGSIWVTLALAGAVLGMLAAFSLEGLSAHRHRVKLCSAVGFALGGLAFALVFQTMAGKAGLARFQLPASAAFAGLVGGMGFGLGWRGPKYAVLLGALSAVLLPVSMWLNLEIARRAMVWLVAHGQPDALWVRIAAYAYGLIGFTIYGAIFGLTLAISDRSEADAESDADAAVTDLLPPLPESVDEAENVAPLHHRAAKPAAKSKPVPAPAPAPTSKPAPRQPAPKTVDPSALFEAARRRAAAPSTREEQGQAPASSKSAKTAPTAPAPVKQAKAPAAKAPAAKAPATKAPAAKAPAAKAPAAKAPAAKPEHAEEPARPAADGKRRILHPDFSSGSASAAAPAAPTAPSGGLKILRNYHPDFAAPTTPATAKEAAAPSGEVVDVDHDEELSFIPDEEENELGLDVTAGGKKPATDRPKPAELDIGDSVDEYDFLRSDE